MNKVAEVRIVKITNKQYDGRPYSLIEGYSDEVGIFVTSVSSDIAQQARDCWDFGDTCLMHYDICTDKNFRLKIRITGFEIITK